MDNLEICKVLVNSLCDLSYKTEDGFTALHYAVAYRRSDSMFTNLTYYPSLSAKKHIFSRRWWQFVINHQPKAVGGSG